ncbi:MAG: fatty-acid metabolism regulator protein [Thermotogota bacterium]|nr:fatty-acid metabolism regulator protein [Thermotogota bacterium]
MKTTRIIKGRYADSITLMLIAEELKRQSGVSDAVMNMATPANISIMRDGGFQISPESFAADDLIIGIDADPENGASLLNKAEEWLSAPPWKKSERAENIDSPPEPFSDANLAIVSVTGKYAAVEAYKSLEKGLNVMLFSDNVTKAEEISLKRQAHSRGLLVMGPDCGTAVINGVGLGFANRGKTGVVGIVGASGTGIQETYTLLQKRGIGILHAIGTGGRDIKDEVGGITFLDGLQILWEDPRVSIIVCVSKPLSDTMKEKIGSTVARLDKKYGQKPVVYCYAGDKRREHEAGRYYCTGFEETARTVEALVKKTPVNTVLAQMAEERRILLEKCAEILSIRGTPRPILRGFYTGGTLCYEAQSVLSEIIPDVYSNAPLDPKHVVADALNPEGHCLIDYGEDAFTQGRLHPMIDPSLRNAQMKKQALRPEVGVVLFDVVLGFGCHENPSEELAQVIKEVYAAGKENRYFLCSITGLDEDPQDARKQRQLLESAGVIVCGSNSEAAYIAGNLIVR